MADIRINALATTATTPASDDYLALDGAAQGTRKILATNIANNVTDVILGSSGPSVKSTLSARAPRQGLVFDGTAQGSTATSITALGTTYSVAFWINPDNVSGTKVILNNGTRSVVYLDNAAITTPGGVATGISLTAGKMALVVLSNTAGTMTPYLNGVALSNITQSVSIEAGTYTIGGSGTAYMAGFLSPLIYNRALSASEVVALYEAGAPSGSDYNSASNTSKVAATFASGWTAAGGATLAATATIPNGATVYQANLQTPGKKVRFTVTVDSISAGVIQYYNGSAYVTFASTPGTYTVEYTSGSVVNQFIFAAVGGTVVLSSPSVYWIGLLLAPDAAQAGGGLTWYDTSGNAANITLPASGVSWNVPSSRVLGGNWTTSGTLTVNGGTANLSAPSPDSFTLNYLSGTSSVGSVVVNPSTGELRTNMGPSASWGGFQTWRTDTTERMRLTNSGNFLLGTTTDGGQKLQVSGTARVSNSISVENNLTLTTTSNPRIYWNSGQTAWIDYTSDAWTFRHGGTGTTSLSLDSNGNATVAGSAGIGGAPSGTYGKLSVHGGLRTVNDTNSKLEIGRYSSGVQNSYIKIGSSSSSLRVTNAADSVDLLTLTDGASGGNLGLNTPDQFGSGVGVFSIKNAVTVPSTNPTACGILYVEAGALKYRGSSGTVTTIANA